MLLYLTELERKRTGRGDVVVEDQWRYSCRCNGPGAERAGELDPSFALQMVR